MNMNIRNKKQLMSYLKTGMTLILENHLKKRFDGFMIVKQLSESNITCEKKDDPTRSISFQIPEENDIEFNENSFSFINFYYENLLGNKLVKFFYKN